MPTNQLFYGKVSSVSPSNENIVITTGDFTDGSNQFTIADNDLVRVGQTLTYIDSQFTGTVTITNVSGTTITVDQNANSNAGSGQTIGLNTPSGEYLISSASFLDPQNVLTVSDITGSANSNFSADGIVYGIIGSAATTGGTLIPGRFYLYRVKEVLYRDESSAELSAFVDFFNSGSEADTGDKLYIGNNQSLPIVELSKTSSLATIFNSGITGLTDVAIGSEVAAYQLSTVRFFDNIATGSGTGNAFPFTGSAEITGSLGVTGSVEFIKSEDNADFFLIKSGSFSSFKFNNDGVGIFGNFNSLPTAVAGGFAYSGSNFYAGIE